MSAPALPAITPEALQAFQTLLLTMGMAQPAAPTIAPGSQPAQADTGYPPPAAGVAPPLPPPQGLRTHTTPASAHPEVVKSAQQDVTAPRKVAPFIAPGRKLDNLLARAPPTFAKQTAGAHSGVGSHRRLANGGYSVRGGVGQQVYQPGPAKTKDMKISRLSRVRIVFLCQGKYILNLTCRSSSLRAVRLCKARERPPTGIPLDRLTGRGNEARYG
jgi:hypothetical protein